MTVLEVFGVGKNRKFILGKLPDNVVDPVS